MPESDRSPTANSLDEAVELLRNRDERGVAALFGLLSGGALFFVRRSVGDHPGNAEIVRRVLLLAAQAALDGKIPNGQAMSEFVLRSIRELAPRTQKSSAPGDAGPSHTAVIDAVSRLPRVDREVLRRFYALGHPPERICADLHIKEAAFREILARVRKLYLDSRPRAAAHAAGRG